MLMIDLKVLRVRERERNVSHASEMEPVPDSEREREMINYGDADDLSLSSLQFDESTSHLRCDYRARILWFFLTVMVLESCLVKFYQCTSRATSMCPHALTNRKLANVILSSEPSSTFSVSLSLGIEQISGGYLRLDSFEEPLKRSLRLTTSQREAVNDLRHEHCGFLIALSIHWSSSFFTSDSCSNGSKCVS